MRCKKPSLRFKLAATVISTCVIMGTVGGANIYVAGEAREAVAAARQNHRLVAAYGELSYQAARLETEMWEALVAGGDTTPVVSGPARARFAALLEESRRAAEALGPRQAAVNAGIRAEAPRLLAAIDRLPAYAQYVDRGGFLAGSAEFGARTEAVFKPPERFRDALEHEVDAGSRALGAATSRGARLTRHLNFSGLALMGLGLLLTSFLLVLILKRLRGGLEKLERGAIAFGRGDLNCRIGLGGGDELAAISHAFDSMAKELGDKQQALQAAKAGLETAVTARTAELESANAALAAEDNRRRRFLADVSHELRTPLTIIRGEAQVALRAAERGPVEPTAPFGRILEQTQGMGRLVDDLFLIARAEAGGLSLAKQPMNLRECAARVANDFDALAAERGASVRALPGPPVPIQADPDRLRQILAALVDNALRHTRPGVQVTLDARLVDAGAGEGWAEVSVLDDGPGLPDASAELFGRFARGETRGDGTGHAHSDQRSLAEAHGGSARLEPGEAGGARAVVRLPIPHPLAGAGGISETTRRSLQVAE